MGIAVWRGYTKKAAPAPAVVEEKDVNFYDYYDGTIVASYSAADFANLSALPANPSHSGLVAEGWNWTLSDAQTYVAANGGLDIGQTYHTVSGYTENIVRVNSQVGMTLVVNATAGYGEWGIQIDWGDGNTETVTAAGAYSHTYTNEGEYAIVGIVSGLFASLSLDSAYLPLVIGIRQGASGSVFAGGENVEYVILSSLVTTNIRISGKVKHFNVPSNRTSIPQCNEAKYLETLSFGKTTYQTTNSGFQNCKKLKRIWAKDVLLLLKQHCFLCCYNLKEIGINSSLINNGAFEGCVSLEKVEIGGNCTEIQDNAFMECCDLGNVYIYATTPPTLGIGVFYKFIINGTLKIYVPNGTLAAYQAATNWSAYASDMVELPA